MPSAVGHALGLHQSPGRAPLEMLKSYFRNSLRAPMLLLFDNFEHMTAARIPGGGSTYVESSPQGAGHQPRSAAHLRRTGISRADAGGSRSQIAGGARCLASISCAAFVSTARSRSETGFRNYEGQCGCRRYHLRATRRIAAGHRTRCGADQTAFAFGHAVTAGEPAATAHRRRSGPAWLASKLCAEPWTGVMAC